MSVVELIGILAFVVANARNHACRFEVVQEPPLSESELELEHFSGVPFVGVTSGDVDGGGSGAIVMADGGRVGVSACKGLDSFGLERHCLCRTGLGIRLDQPEVSQIFRVVIPSPDEKELLLLRDSVEAHCASGIGCVGPFVGDLFPFIGTVTGTLQALSSERPEIVQRLVTLALSPVDVHRPSEEGCPVSGSWAGCFSRCVGHSELHVGSSIQGDLGDELDIVEGLPLVVSPEE